MMIPSSQPRLTDFSQSVSQSAAAHYDADADADTATMRLMSAANRATEAAGKVSAYIPVVGAHTDLHIICHPSD